MKFVAAKNAAKPDVERGTEKKALEDVKGEQKEEEKANGGVENEYNN